MSIVGGIMNRVSLSVCAILAGSALTFAATCNARGDDVVAPAKASKKISSDPDQGPADTGQSAKSGEPILTNVLQEVTVSASHIVRPGFVSPTPITSVSASEIAATGATNINDVLQYIPEMTPYQTSTSNDNKQFTAGANYADLRGLGSQRTLVLLDGQRFVPEVPIYNLGLVNQVDLNVFPTIALKRVDVVTGGASAVWGSDAIAGVVNLVPYTRYDGLMVAGSAGISQYGDDRTNDLSVLGGRSFIGGRAHFVVAASYDQTDGVGDIFSRPWGADAPYVLPNTAACADCWKAGTGYQNATYAPGGVITNTALAGTAFGPGGQPYPFPSGTFEAGSSGEFGGSVPGNYPQAGVLMEPPSRRESLYSDFSYDFSDRLNVDLMINSSESHATDGTKPYLISYTVQSGNPYIPSSIQSYMTTNGISSFKLGAWDTDISGGRIQQELADTVNRVSLGMHWDIGDGWTSHGYYTMGESYVAEQFPDNIDTVAAAQAADAVLAPNGQIVCANPANGCVPLDVFGTGTASPGALGYVLKNSWSKVRYVQQAAEYDVSGEPLHIWAGPVSLAGGAAWRHEEQKDTSDPYQVANQMLNIDNENFAGQFSDEEEYLETVVPLLKGLPMARELDINAADREIHYSTVGNVNVWKYGAVWHVNRALMFRATRSRDIRAPSVEELYYPVTLLDAEAPIAGQSEFASVYSGGNSALKPEVAMGTTAGLTYLPAFIPGLSFSWDIFHDDLSNVISSESSTSVLDACDEGSATACAQIIKVGGLVTRINAGTLNVSRLDYEGMDAELDYTLSLDKIGLPGSLEFRELGTYTNELAYQVQPGLPFINYAGQVTQGVELHTAFYTPRFRGEFSAGYHVDGFSTTLMADFVSAGVADKTLTTAEYPENNVPSYVKFDWLGSYQVDANGRWQLFWTVNNLFNKAPPFAPNPLEFIPTDPNFYDIIGRTFQVGFRYRM